jgi:porin
MASEALVAGGCRLMTFGLVLVALPGTAAAQEANLAAVTAISAAPERGSDEPTSMSAEPVLDGMFQHSKKDGTPAVDVSVVYTAEVFANALGGRRRGTRYLDNLDVTLSIDAERALGWKGATIFAYGLYNNGKPFAEEVVGAAQGVSNVETGVRAPRLYEAWVEQRFAGDRASVKLGLYDLNSEFDAIEAASLFINPSHGIGPDFSQSGRNGPSIFPVTSLALRADYKPGDRWTLRAAILDGVPGDPDQPSRTTIRLNRRDGALGAVEVNRATNHMRAGVGYWRYSGSFQRLSGKPARKRGNDGFYAFIEGRLSREEGDKDQGLAGWIRLGFADPSFNPIKHYLGGGLTYTGPIRGRDADQVGLAIGSANFGGAVRRSSALVGDPLQARELIIEATYRAPVTRRLTIQPDLQIVFGPGGRRTTSDALILGLRGEIGF